MTRLKNWITTNLEKNIFPLWIPTPLLTDSDLEGFGQTAITLDDPCCSINSNSPTINDNEQDEDENIIFKGSMNEDLEEDANLLDEVVLPDIN